ncbi:MAG: Serine protease Do-like HtrA [Firmicutes bacterium ADurb.Bin248]|nr:MAG: Serine protease Do-like HtrA [Firmicutes bacterium ADurb.Bin248]HOG00784.1 trypsin-like peptidase domain-containing protein [Clostridia bacterium]HPK15939.1 trypsin-like peptidase domain-containing protein [Clostridia bacterium]
MEYPNYYYENQNPQGYGERKRRGVGGYVVTAVVFTLVGALLATILAGGELARSPEQKPQATWTPQPTSGGGYPAPTPRQTPGIDETPFVNEGPLLTPEAARGSMPALDGKAPVIGDVANPIPDIVEQVSAGVVGIVNYGFNAQYGDYSAQATGSGFVISSEGYILTNAHVIAGASKLGVMFTDGTEEEATLVGYDNTSDLAVLRVKHTGLYALKLGDSDALRVGEYIITIGDPTGRELAGTTTFGIVSATQRTITIDGQTNTYIQVDAAVNPGNSGGPLINLKGETVGIVSAKTVTASYDDFGNAISAEGLGFALPINEVLKIAEQLIKDGFIKRPGIGISVLEWPEERAREYDTVTGILVATVIKDGPGDNAGLRPNDIIVEVDGQSVPLQSDFVALVKSKRVGDSLSLKVWRGGEYFETTLTLGDLNLLGSELVDGEADYSFYD